MSNNEQQAKGMGCNTMEKNIFRITQYWFPKRFMDIHISFGDIMLQQRIAIKNYNSIN